MGTYHPRPVRLRDIQTALGGEIVGDPSTQVIGASSLEAARPGELAYVASDRQIKAALQSHASAFVVSRPLAELNSAQLVVESPAYTLARIIQQFFTAPYSARGISESASIGSDVRIGPDPSIWPFVTLGDRVTLGARVTLYPGVFVGDDCTVGDDAVLYPRVSLMRCCVLGDRVTVHSGAVIGSDGFGYLQEEGVHYKVPQIGIVVIEDDVEIGANVSIDRATFGRTLIKRGTKIDNLVQIAHNVTVGEHCVLVAQVGVAGSTTLGNRVMVGGQAGVSDHVEIGDEAKIAARSGVNRHVAPREVVSGAPILPHDIWIRAQAVVSRLPEIRQQVRDLERRIRELENARTKRRKEPPQS